MPSLKSLVADLHKPFSGMLGGWHEGHDHVPSPDLRTTEQIAEDEAREEIASSHMYDDRI